MTDVPHHRRHVAAALRAGQALDLSLCSYAETGDAVQLEAARLAACRVLAALTHEAGRMAAVPVTLARSA